MSFGRTWRAQLTSGPPLTLEDPANGRVLRFEPGGPPLIVSETLAKQLAPLKHTRSAWSAVPFDVTEARFIIAAEPRGWGG